MTGHIAKNASLRRNRRLRCVKKPPKYWICGELACFGASLGVVSAILVTRRLEMEDLILV